MTGMGADRKGVNESLIVSAFHQSLSTQAQVLILALVVVAVVLVVGRLIAALLADPGSGERPGGQGRRKEVVGWGAGAQAR